MPPLTSQLEAILKQPQSLRTGETAFHALIHTTQKAHDHVLKQFSKEHSPTVIYHDIPYADLLGGKGKASKAVLLSLLSALTRITHYPRIDIYTIAPLLRNEILRHRTRMLILNHAHNMTTAINLKPLLHDFYVLINQLRIDIMPPDTSVVIAGTSPAMTDFLDYDDEISGRFTRLKP
jgi:hypothetical protein